MEVGSFLLVVFLLMRLSSSSSTTSFSMSEMITQSITPTPTPPPNCNCSNGQLTYNQNGIEVCVDGQWITMCSRQGIEVFNDTEKTNVTCTYELTNHSDDCNSTQIRAKCLSCSGANSSQPMFELTIPLSAATGGLFAVLVATMLGWICTCAILRRKISRTRRVWRPTVNSTGLQTRTNVCYSLQQSRNRMNDGTIPTRARDRNYELVVSTKEDSDIYDRLQHDQQIVIANEKGSKDKPSKSEDDFYNTSQHTYSQVNIEHKKKAKGKREESPVYDEALITGESSVGERSEDALCKQ